MRGGGGGDEVRYERRERGRGRWGEVYMRGRGDGVRYERRGRGRWGEV